MLDRLWEFLAGLAESLTPWVIVYEYEQGVHLRLGRYYRTLGPGFHWTIPLVDTALTETIVPNTAHLRDQSLITKDGEGVSLSAVVTYVVSDVRKFLLEVEGRGTAVADISYGAIAEWVSENTLEALRDPKNWRKIATEIRRAGAEYGISVSRVKLSDITRSRTLRLLGDRG